MIVDVDDHGVDHDVDHATLRCCFLMECPQALSSMCFSSLCAFVQGLHCRRIFLRTMLPFSCTLTQVCPVCTNISSIDWCVSTNYFLVVSQPLSDLSIVVCNASCFRPSVFQMGSTVFCRRCSCVQPVCTWCLYTRCACGYISLSHEGLIVYFFLFYAQRLLP